MSALTGLLELAGEHHPNDSDIMMLRDLAQKDLLTRAHVTERIGRKEHAQDVYLRCVGTALTDHILSDAELLALKHLRTALGVSGQELFADRRADVERVVSDVMFLILADRQVSRDERRLRAGLQEALELGYDDFEALGERPIHDALVRILQELDPSGQGLSDSQFAAFERRALKLEAVFPLRSRADAAGRRHIPQHVKDAVWRRDQGKCTGRSGQQHLEFDHIIPFSLGGASTYRNVQLLCQTCNRSKSDQIG